MANSNQFLNYICGFIVVSCNVIIKSAVTAPLQASDLREEGLVTICMTNYRGASTVQLYSVFSQYNHGGLLEALYRNLCSNTDVEGLGLANY